METTNVVNKHQNTNNVLFIVAGIVLLILTLASYSYLSSHGEQSSIKIGIITDLSGPAAYWGQSTRVGAQLAADDLNSQGYTVDLIFEDYQLDAPKALTAAQKLVTVDDVDALYADFNPAAVAVGSFLKGKGLLFVYAAAVESPLNDSLLTYKTYLDYRAGCSEIAQRFKQEGVQTIGMLKINLEAGQLCAQGVQSVFGENTLIEAYDLGDRDLSTQVQKLKQNGAMAIINVGFEDDTLNTLRAMHNQGITLSFGTVEDTITNTVVERYNSALNGSWTFGFGDVDPAFKSRLPPSITEYGAALAYTHIKQMVKSIAACKNDPVCIQEHMDASSSDQTIGFDGFQNSSATLEMKLRLR